VTDKEKRGDNAEVAKGRIKRVFDRLGKVSDVSWVLLGAGLLVGFLFGVSAGLEEITERTKFIAGNVLSVLALIVIVLQSLIYHRQRDIMEKQLRLMRSQTNSLALQAQISLDQRDLTEGQARTMDKSLVFGTRAYVGVHSIVFDPHKKRIFLQIENIGKVPAKNIQVTLEMLIRIPEHLMPSPAPDGTRRGWEYIEGNRPDHPGGAPLGEWELRIPWLHPYGRTQLFPGSLKIGIMIRLDEVIYLTPQQYGAITAGHAKLIVRGIITYSDGFHKGKRTEFAFRYYLRDNLWISLPQTGLEMFHTDPEQPESDYNPS
jgi:hypothetical protein